MRKLLLLLLLCVHSMSYAQNATAPLVNSQTATAPSPNTPVKIGEEISIDIQTAHPYNTSGVEGVVFEQEFYNKYSSYIKLYFEDFNLAPGDYVEIIGANTGESVIYAEQGKVIDQNMTMISTFWSQVIFDEKVIVRLHSQHPVVNDFGFKISTVAYGYPEQVINQILQTKAICGQDDKEHIICYNGTTMWDQSRAVCRLIIGGSGSCTGWLLGCDGHVMTNNHCIGTAGDASNTDFVFDYHYTNCNGTGTFQPDVVATSSTFIKTSSSLDYTLVQLPTNPTATYGYLSLSSVPPVVNDQIYIVGHPGGRRKEITVNTDLGGNTGGFAIVNQITATGCRYMADTEGGSSGSPVLNSASNLVVAIHNTGGCTNGSSGRSDQLIAAIGADMPNCGIDSSGTTITPCGSTIASFPYTESFENTFGAWTQDASDDFDWLTLQGATPSTGTGPTAANAGNYYAYMEASNPNNPNKVANLLSPCFNLAAVSYPELIFNYHMFGPGMGVLNVQVSTNGATWTTLWTRNGDQGNQWIVDTIDLNAYTTETELRIRFNGEVGASFESDIAIDAVQISQGTPNCALVTTFPYNEDFENTFGDWTQDLGDDFDWATLQGATPSTGTGPTAAISGDYYAYMEASNPNNPSKVANLISPCFDLTGLTNPELTFSYHMFGATTMGTLKLEASVGGGNWTTLWSRTGNQGNQWVPASVSLVAYGNATDLRLRFNGETGADFEGDIAIDGLSVGSTVFACGTTVSNFPYSEGFENTLGAWTQETVDEFDWTNNTGGTPSNNTGPSAASEGSYYMYTEASNPNNPNRTAILVSPCFDLTGMILPEISFDYHLYGDQMGILRLEVRTSTTPWASLLTRSGDQGNQWNPMTVSLAAYAGVADVQLRFNGETGVGFRSDMAIDDIEVSDAFATNVTTAQKEESFLTVSPNPFKNYIEVSTNLKDISNYTILNVQGQVVQEGTMQKRTILVNDLAQGVYLIRFTNGTEHFTRKIVKQ